MVDVSICGHKSIYKMAGSIAERERGEERGGGGVDDIGLAAVRGVDLVLSLL